MKILEAAGELESTYTFYTTENGECTGGSTGTCSLRPKHHDISQVKIAFNSAKNAATRQTYTSCLSFVDQAFQPETSPR